MSVNRNIRDELPQDSLIFDNPAYDNSIIGYSTSGNVIYDFDSMIEELSSDDKISFEEAIDFIDYNTIGACPPLDMGDNPPPIIMYRIIK